MRFSIAILAVALLPGTALAKDPAKRFSLDLGFGITPDMADLGTTIAQDGTVDTADSTVANMVYSTDKALMSDRNNLALYYNSKNTGSAYNLLGKEPTIGNPMLGSEIGLRGRYELDDVIDFPLFVQAGFFYTTRMSGGQQSRTLGDAVVQDPTIANLMQLNGENPADYAGGTMVSNYNASWLEIPIAVGLKIPVDRRHTYAYGAVGASWFRGGFSVDLDVDEKYANALTTHLDTDALTVHNLSPGAVKDEIKFVNAGLGMNWQLGVQAGIAKGFAWYAEFNQSGTAGTVYSSKMKAETQQLLTATSSEALAASDDQWFKRLAFPVVTTGAAFRTGLRYYFF